jgi:hypothetical protein
MRVADDAAEARRRRRRMAVARPVTDDVVERFIMVLVLVCFLARREWRDGPSAARPVLLYGLIRTGAFLMFGPGGEPGASIAECSDRAVTTDL